MGKLRSHPSLTSLCLLAAVAAPILSIGTQLAAAPFYPRYSFSLLSVSMLGTHFSRHPCIFNAGEMLTGFATFVGAFGLYRSFRVKTHLLLSWLIGLSVAGTGVMGVKAGMFPLPDPRHNSWAFLFNFTIAIPFLMLVGLWKRSHSAALRAYLLLSIALLLLLIPLIPRLGRGTLQRLIGVGTMVPVGVVGFCFWRELHRDSPDQPESTV